MQYLGIDYGSKRIGLAIAESESGIAFPLQILDNTPRVLSSLVDIIKERDIAHMVMGHSRSNAIMSDIEHFAELLKKETGIPISFQDESWSSHSAARLGGFDGFEKRNQANQRGRQKSQTHVDDSAAAIILQRYLDQSLANSS